VDLLRLVHVQVAALPDFAEGLYADGEFFHGTGECFDKNREYLIKSRGMTLRILENQEMNTF
jgi:hypothetical protein